MTGAIHRGEIIEVRAKFVICKELWHEFFGSVASVTPGNETAHLSIALAERKYQEVEISRA
jgi:hypothetical protein